MNYAAPITVAVMLLSGLWYVLGAHRHYKGPRSNIGSTHERHTDDNVRSITKSKESDSEKDEIVQ